MSAKKGTIALMGSGELTSTMVEVHKKLLSGIGDNSKAVFLDTPAGFQLNVDLISERAVEYFRSRVGRPMSAVSFKSKKTLTPAEAEQAYQGLREADFILIGPGSPTYAVRQFSNTPIVRILKQNVERGGCLVAASAAALTVGAYTLPVYEIYKVGDRIHWVDGLNILSHFGLRLVVVPHWNNAEGGTHDTRYCFMGKERFKKLESLLPEEESILGLDEHTACILDFENQVAEIRGAGRVVLKRRKSEAVFEKGDRVPLSVLATKDIDSARRSLKKETTAPVANLTQERPDSFWQSVHDAEDRFRQNLAAHDFQKAASDLLELDRIVWKARQDLESEEFISQAREILRELIMVAGTEADRLPKSRAECLAALVEELLEFRRRLREKKMWDEADALRQCLLRAGIVVEDSPDGSRWHQVESRV